MYGLIRAYHGRIRDFEIGGIGAIQGWPGAGNFGQAIANCHRDLSAHQLPAGIQGDLDNVLSILNALIQGHSRESKGRTFYDDFAALEIRDLTDALEALLAVLPDGEPEVGGVSIDAPHKFDHTLVPDRIEFLASDPQFAAATQHVGSMVVRLRTLLRDERIRPVIATDEGQDLAAWLETYLGGGDAQEEPANITVINLSLVPSDVLHICVAVIGRVVFEALQRYRKVNAVELPTVLVLEEAHTFVSGGPTAVDEGHTPRTMCRRVFERIAREGRKFGLSLVLSSQRPSELSPTVLAQCNSFLLHRLVNDADQQLVKRLVPDALGDLLSELPSLPSRQAVLLGWAAQLPTLVEIRELAPAHRPHSSDPRYWDVWTGAVDRPTNWEPIIEDWLG